MIEHLEKEPRAVKLAAEAYRKLGIEPKYASIRGGTDGSRLSEMGLPTPNISTGMHNFHSPLEFACLEEMETSVKVLIELAQLWGKEKWRGSRSARRFRSSAVGAQLDGDPWAVPQLGPRYGFVSSVTNGLMSPKLTAPSALMSPLAFRQRGYRAWYASGLLNRSTNGLMSPKSAIRSQFRSPGR